LFYNTFSKNLLLKMINKLILMVIKILMYCLETFEKDIVVSFLQEKINLLAARALFRVKSKC
jgi:hypothetical protein